ncbi:LysR family transcriptional regulator [Marinobacterium jannaschii]|uniref:LysR family transcriptional regulator n=1 Tax=Marinobacterium jannaschii TaxID=64970 RepID=UPI00048735F7|nr:LysR family transcriptional regulator [Marinobacterium jannaschii]
MDLELLRTFLEVCRTRHFGQAAEALHLTQAAVSARIKQLEGRLGVSLFDRSKREIRLTPEAHRLMRHSDLLLSEWRNARQEVTAGGATHQISVGGSLRLWDALLQQWLYQFRSARPDVALSVESHTPELLTRKLLDGVLDIAFMLEPAQLEVLQICKVGELKLILVSDQPGLTLDAALHENYLMVDWGLGHNLTHRRLFPDMPEPHTRLSNAKMAIGYIKHMGGSAYLPRSMIREELAAARLHQVNDAPVIEHSAYAVYPLRSPKIELIDEIIACFGKIS